MARLLVLAAILLPCALQAQFSGDRVTIAVMTDMSGVYSDLAGQGAVIAAEMVREDWGGEVAGRTIEIIPVDHRNDPKYAVSRAKTLVEERGVDAIAELMGSEVAVAVQEYARDAGVTTLVSGATTPRLTNESCSPTGVHWAHDAYALAVAAGTALVAQGEKSWFLLTVDYPLGDALEQAVAAAVTRSGGKVIGRARHPFQAESFVDPIGQAQASGADAVALLNAGADTYNAIRQGYELGLMHGDQSVTGLLFITDIRKLGLYVTSGLNLASAFYWNQSEAARQWSERFAERHGAMPTAVQASVYSSLNHYFKAVEDTGTDADFKVVERMRERPVSDFFAPDGRLRADGRMVHTMRLARVKRPSESAMAWDYFEIVGKVPGDKAFLPLSMSRCPRLDE